MAWANLGALVEGALRWFASVYADHYFADDAAPRAPKSTDPDELDEVKFERLRTFFAKRVWVPTDRYDGWIQVVQQRRNTIHAFRSRPLGSFAEFRAHVVLFADMLNELERRVPDRPPGEC